jgi:NitT/TauT family transport system ATP-binding protein
MANDANIIVEADNITHYYQRGAQIDPVLQGICLQVPRGEFVSIVGASGCGKSTLLRLLAGLDLPTEGMVLVAGEPPQRVLSKHLIGLAFQKPRLFPWWTVLDNILLPIKLWQRGVSREDRQQAFTYLEQLGIADTANLYPQQLSGGMLQRAAIARALVGKPKVLLLDEPFSAVDEITRDNLCVDFHRIWRNEGLTVILVTHSIHEAVFMSDRVLVMSQRPAIVKSEFLVPFDKYRDDDLFSSNSYTQLIAQIRGSL